MNRFVRKMGFGLAKVILAFIVIAIGARFIGAFNWFFFQKNEHNSVFLTMVELERMLEFHDSVDVLIMGSSASEFSLDPRILAQSTGLKTFKCVTGGQTLDMSVNLAHYLAPKLSAKYLIVDAYPRFGPGLTEEGVERIILNAPNAASELTRTVLESHPYSLNTNYLWAARPVGTFIKPYSIQDLEPHPDFVMAAPGYSERLHDPAPEPIEFESVPLPAEAIDLMNGLHKELNSLGIKMMAIIPPLQNAEIALKARPEFELIRPQTQEDSCFRDAVHLRKVCVPAYTQEIARLFNEQNSKASVNDDIPVCFKN